MRAAPLRPVSSTLSARMHPHPSDKPMISPADQPDGHNLHPAGNLQQDVAPSRPRYSNPYVTNEHLMRISFRFAPIHMILGPCQGRMSISGVSMTDPAARGDYSLQTIVPPGGAASGR